MAANSYAIKPTLPEPFPNTPRFWTCPKTGLVVPKQIDENLAWRVKILREADKDEGFQRELMAASALSILFWINAFAYTFKIIEVDAEGRRRQNKNRHLPFITWEIQDRHILAIEDAVNVGYSLLTDKTREMGASWDHIAVFHHQLLFIPDKIFLEMSRVESDVDGADNPRALFVKHDYINRWLPNWMVPKEMLPGGSHRSKLHIANPLNRSRIDGESSNKAAGSSARCDAILLDEMAKMENATKIKSSVQDVANCLLPNSTPYGAGTAYSNWRNSGQIKVFQMPWWEHPEKGRGRYLAQDEASGKWKIRSPWYDMESEKRTPQEMAQEIDMDHIGSGATFFESMVLEQHRIMFARPETTIRSIDFMKGVALDALPDILRKRDRGRIKVSRGKPLRIWPTLIDGRLDQTKNYVIACDISKGQGASNSVMSIACCETREKVGEWADANTPPYEMARIFCALALWVGGSRGLPLAIWEANGPGWDFGRMLVKQFEYPFYYFDRAIDTVAEKKTLRYGWHSSRNKKELLLSRYRSALAFGGFVNHSAESLVEAETYIYYEGGGLGPAGLIEESEEARKTHGDRVMADALCVLGMPEQGQTKPPKVEAPHRSMAYRKQLLETRRKAARRLTHFDFRT